MREGFYISVLWSAALFVLAAGSIAWGQVEPISDMPMTLSGVTGVGLAGASGDGPGSDSLYWSTAATLDGYYHDPRFLKFNVSPMYTYDRDAEAEDLFHDDNEGVSANVSFRNSSTMPINFSYGLNWNGNTAITSGPNPISSEASGFSHNWSLSGNYHRNFRWPTFSFSYGSGGNDSKLAYGEAGQLSYHHRNLQLTSTYNILGFRLFGNYNLFHSEEESPDLLSLGLGGTNTSDQKSYIAGGDRALPWIKGNTDFRYSRTETTGSLLAGGATQTFDNASATLNSTPSKRLVLNATALYNSNGLAQILSGFLVNNQNGALTPYSTTIFTPLGASQVITGSASYQVGHGFNLYGVVGQEKDDISSVEDATALTTAGGVGYGHVLFGGSLAASYNIGRTNVLETAYETNAAGVPVLVSIRNDVLTQSATAAYFKPVGRWTMAGNFRFVDTGLAQTGVSATGVSRSFGTNIAASTRFLHAWNFTLAGNYNRSDITPAGANATVSEGLTASMGNRTLNVTGQFQRSSGYSTTSAFGIAPITQPGVATVIYPYASVYNSVSNGDTLTVTWTHRRLILNGNYSHTGLDLSQTELESNVSKNSYWFIQSRYRLRKLTFRAEFRHWTQSATANQALNLSTNSYIFEVLRPFRLF
jgi:hypothetical protein